MRGSYTNKFLSGIFLFCIFFSFFPLYGCASGKQASVTTPTKIKGRKEILVAEDIGRGGDIYPPHWCGNNALLYAGEEIGVELIDLTTGKRTRISEYQHDTPLNCTPDGKWVVYHESDAVKVEKDWDASWEEYLKENWPDGVFTHYIHRYEVETGRREKVAAESNDEWGWYEALSPDGKKILLGAENTLDTDIYVPEWKPVWFSNDWWGRQGTVWFSDSSGVVHSGANRICVEFLGEDGWTKCFELELEYYNSMMGFMLDREDRIYFQEVRSERLDPDSLYVIHRCEIKGRELVCEEVIERIGGFGNYAILPDGDLVFQVGNICIQRMSPWRSESECVVDARHYVPEYVGVEMVGVSPDGRWLAFEKRRNELRVKGGWHVRPADLFVIDLKND